ncbi:MAG: hypothetical protein H0T14_06570 [Nocardioidaceae bacterium]|nr:hypothetical protein [Nocardioidaceae bacterium]
MHVPLTLVDPRNAMLSVGRIGAPLWVPWPIPDGWSFAGLAHTETARRPATVTSWSARDPFGDPTEILFVSEEAGTGLGAQLAGFPLNYPTGEVGIGPPHAKFDVAGHVVSLWAVEAKESPSLAEEDDAVSVVLKDRAVYAGEAAGRWLWVIVHPAEAGVIVIQPLSLFDAHTLGAELTLLPVCELSPRLVIAASEGHRAGGP